MSERRTRVGFERLQVNLTPVENYRVTTRLALLIDAENITAPYADSVIEAARTHGDPIVRRAYGNFADAKLTAWHSRLGPLGIHSVSPLAGKNSADIALAIDAMDLLYAGVVDGFAIASNDADFVRVATRLREAGKQVIGVGTAAMATHFAAACTSVVTVKAIEPVKMPVPVPAPRVAPKPVSKLQKMVTAAVTSTRNSSGWSGIQEVATHLYTQQAGFALKNHGAATLTKLLTTQDYLTSQGKGNNLKVRLRG